MSDNFDPDAWPYNEGTGSGQRSGSSSVGSQRRTDDDDYDALDFDQAPQQGQYSDPNAFDDYGFDDAPPSASHLREPASAGRRDDFNDDDFSNDFGTGDDFDFDGPQGGQRGQGSSQYDDFDDEYGDDYDDFDDEYDREPAENNGRGKRLLLGGAAVVLLLIGIVVGANAIFGGDDNSNTASNTTATTAAGSADSNGLTNPDGSTDTTAAPADNGSAAPAGNGTTGTVEDAPADVVKAMNDGLVAWGQFAVDGNLDDVRPYFVNNGSQFDRFTAEAQSIGANPPGGTPLSMTMAADQSVKVDDNTWLIKGNVTVTRPNDPSQLFPWEIRISRENADVAWQIESVRQY